jgi:Winged helix-turn-helix DNA-binding
MDEIDQEILAMLADKPGLKASQIARKIGVSRKIINHFLYGSLKKKVSKDESHRWSLVGSDSDVKSTRSTSTGVPVYETAVDSGDIGWLFRRVGADEVETEITQRDQFRNDDVELSDTVVRESIQNSLDAQVGTDQVRVRFALLTEDDGISVQYLESLCSGQFEHAKSVGVDVDSVSAEPPSAFVIEDFGTTGLTGATDSRVASNFSDFWHRHGKSHKSGKSGGRWGLGKLVYSYSSHLSMFFGLTRRDKDISSYLMGQTVLDTHKINGQYFAPHGFFAIPKPDGQDQGLQLPTSNTDKVSAFSEEFDLQRVEQPGLSIVIPMPRSELDIEDMVAVGVTNYFFPVLTDQLILDFNNVRVDKSTLRTVALEYAEGRIDDAELLFDFVEAAHSLPDDEMLVLDTRWYDDWKLQDDDFDSDLLEILRERFAKHELIGIRLRVDIRLKNDDVFETSYDLYLKTHPDLSRGHDLYVRSGITVPNESKFKHRKALGALVAREEAVSEFLGDAENAAHTKWNTRAEKLTKKYKYAPQTLTAIRRSLLQLHDILAHSVEEEVEDALLDFFWSPAGSSSSRRKPKRTGPAKVPKLPRQPAPLRVQSSDSGFKIVPGDGAVSTNFPIMCTAEVAYDVATGNPFKRWEPFDFELGKSKGIPVSGKNAKPVSLSGNVLKILVEDPDFLVQVDGFDKARDVIVKISTSEVDQE